MQRHSFFYSDARRAAKIFKASFLWSTSLSHDSHILFIQRMSVNNEKSILLETKEPSVMTMMINRAPKSTQKHGYFVFALFVVVALYSHTRIIEADRDEHRLSLESSSIAERKLDKTKSGPSPTDSAGPPPWCPNAVCHNSALCHPCQRRFLIIIATGRSASTTLMYMMNSLPRVRMSGENNNTLGAIRTMISNIKDAPQFQRQQENPRLGAWSHNPVPDSAFACVAQHMIETINPPLLNEDLQLVQDDTDTIIGFKTIRFLDNVSPSEDKDMVEYVQQHFPCSRILVNIRSDTRTQAISYANKKNFQTQLRGQATLEQMNERLRRVASMFGSQAMLLDSSDWTKNIDRLNQVVQWLGFHDSCKFERLLEFNTRGKGYVHGETELAVDPNCRYIGVER